jgi:1-acyl-sn-glycerol-3-phosphate acyltransferase
MFGCMRKFSRFLLKLFGWTCVTTVPNPSKSVICVAPHTSNWDFILGYLYYWAEDRKARFLIKKSWFAFPFGALFRRLGGVPVDRSRSTSVIAQMVEQFSEHENFHLAITPEGTRSFVKKWKMGFYHIAVEANVPIQLAAIDYKKKELGITGIFYPTGDEAADLKAIQDFYKDVTARFPGKFYREKKGGLTKAPQEW